ncbi:hypothetical protein Ahy_B05g077553 isoform C [Arachis hypogaea]|uniref:Pentacotripeptide-repeat region of PRORP domain-containing protein n=1 Tax=Arachis hypogaea TaxID=3818 RepID=A0A444Z520_ARAHY|nr:hypothetical protein Ahy_B05g077553 isoform C [Arachis hypogaea]
MASQMTILSRARSFIPKPTLIKTISTFPSLFQEPQLATPEPTHPTTTTTTSLPPNPASGSPLYNENWRNPIPPSSFTASSITPQNLFTNQQQGFQMQTLSNTHDATSLMNLFASWMASQQWADVKALFEAWVRSLDKNGKPNKPDVGLFNHYLRANLMLGASAAELLDLLAQMDEFQIVPNTASFNLVLKAMYQANETVAAEKLIERMLQTGNESLPDAESYNLVIGMLFQSDQIDAAFKHIDLSLKSGSVLSMNVFMECVKSCVKKHRLDLLVTIIERCRVSD